MLWVFTNGDYNITKNGLHYIVWEIYNFKTGSVYVKLIWYSIHHINVKREGTNETALSVVKLDKSFITVNCSNLSLN